MNELVALRFNMCNFTLMDHCRRNASAADMNIVKIRINPTKHIDWTQTSSEIFVTNLKPAIGVLLFLQLLPNRPLRMMLPLLTLRF